MIFLNGCSTESIIYNFDIKIKEYKDSIDIEKDKKLNVNQESIINNLKNILVFDAEDEEKLNPLVLNEYYYNPYSNSLEKAYWINKATNDEIHATGIYSMENSYNILPVFMSEEFYDKFYAKIRNIDESYVFDLETLYQKFNEENTKENNEILHREYPELNIQRKKTFYLKRKLSSFKLPSKFKELYINLGYTYNDTRKQNYLGGYNGKLEKYCIVEIIFNNNPDVPIKYNFFTVSPENAKYSIDR